VMCTLVSEALKCLSLRCNQYKKLSCRWQTARRTCANAITWLT